MALLDDVRRLCLRLESHGWREVFARHGLNIGAADLATELGKPLTIDRSQPGFEDFALDGTRAVEPGDLARSLLYHALASPLVHPVAAGGGTQRRRRTPPSRS